MVSHVGIAVLVDAAMMILHARTRASPRVASHFDGGIVLDQLAPVKNDPCRRVPACLLKMSRLGAGEIVDGLRDGKGRLREHVLKFPWRFSLGRCVAVGAWWCLLKGRLICQTVRVNFISSGVFEGTYLYLVL
jgi:hypothetical protein